MKKKKLSLNKLFQNNKFLIILALVISTITWVYMSMGTTNDTTVTMGCRYSVMRSRLPR